MRGERESEKKSEIRQMRERERKEREWQFAKKKMPLVFQKNKIT